MQMVIKEAALDLLQFFFFFSGKEMVQIEGSWMCVSCLVSPPHPFSFFLLKLAWCCLRNQKANVLVAILLLCVRTSSNI